MIQSQAWQRLKQRAENIAQFNLQDAFTQDEKRAERFDASAAGISLDYSKQLIDENIFEDLLSLAHEAKLKSKITELFSGAIVNPTENRAALHTALRLSADDVLMVNGIDINQGVQASLSKTAAMVEKIRQKVWRGFSGAAITDVVNIGVGGSDLGPLMATTALEEMATGEIAVHFASSIDGTQIDQLLKSLNPEKTLFIVASKSFSTIDTMSNANTALAWLHQRCHDKNIILKNHFIGVSANPKKMSAWGIVPANQLEFWDWVGGRFSLWSTIGLSIAIAIGMDKFKAMLAGARAIDQHFTTAAFENNLPALMGLLGVWNSTFLNIHAHAILPYDGRLKYLPNYLTQLEMESNGKSVTLAGESIDYATAPIIWGDIGSNAQHAFYQLLHQGTQKVSCDFIAPIARYSGDSRDGQKISSQHDESLIKQHNLALANCLAQSRVLAFGNAALNDTDSSQPMLASTAGQYSHKIYRGNQPSNTILLDTLSPTTLGALIALYEHKVFVMSVMWQINPFDQWGVELGKIMAADMLEAIQQGNATSFDSSTNALLSKIKMNHSHE